jgi:hypothetical protein
MRSDEGLAAPHPRIELVCAEFSTIYPVAGDSMPAQKDTLMNQDNLSPDVLEAEKRADAANANSADGRQSGAEGRPRTDADAQAKPVPPMAHPPEDTFVGVGTHPRPEKTGG